MKLFRVLSVCTLLLLAAAPLSAAPLCQDCDEGFSFECGPDSLEHLPCRYTTAGCENYFRFCTGFTAADTGDTSTLLSEWKVASIEIENALTKAVVTPAAVAQADAPQPVSQK